MVEMQRHLLKASNQAIALGYIAISLAKYAASCFLRGRLKRVRRLKPQRRQPSPLTRTQANEGLLSPASAGCVRIAATLVAKATGE